jgi:cytosine/adenosine deaminase-related metal-dependent hydrolase
VADPVTSLVCSARASDVRHVLVRGEILVEDGRATRLDARAVVAEAERQQRSLLERAGEHGYDPVAPSSGGTA